MKYNIIINIIYISLSFEIIITDGVYAILSNNKYLFYLEGSIMTSYNFEQSSLFRIITIGVSLNDNLCNIEEIKNNNKLSLSQDKKLTFNNSINHSQIWSLIRIENNYFIIKNDNYKCFIKMNELKYICDNNIKDEVV